MGDHDRVVREDPQFGRLDCGVTRPSAAGEKADEPRRVSAPTNAHGVASADRPSRAAWIVALRRTPIFRGSVWILGATVATALGGAVFWLVAARLEPAADVGHAAALLSSSNFIIYLTALGLPIAVMRFGGFHTHESRILFNWALVLTAGSSGIAAGCYLLLVGDHARVFAGFGPVGALVAFAVITAGVSVSLLVDTRLIVQRHWSWVFVRASVTAVIRIPLLLLFPAARSPVGLFVLASGIPAATGVFLWWLTTPRQWRYTLRPLPHHAREAARYSAVNYVAGLAGQGATYAIPVVVLLTVSARQNAQFFLAWSIMLVVALLPASVAHVFMAEGFLEDIGRTQTLRALALAEALAVSAFVVAAGGAGFVSSAFGPQYGQVAELLPVLIASIIPGAVVMIALSYARLIDSTRALFGITGCLALTAMVVCIPLAKAGGIVGVSQGWLISQCVTGLVAGIWLVTRIRSAGVAPASEESGRG